MIQVNTNKQVNIILPNTNKALEKILKSASPEELQTLTKGKDLSSLLDGILKGSIGNSDVQNKTLFSLLKDNPTLKELGSVIDNIKALLSKLKQEKSPLPLEKILTSFLSDIKNMSEKDLLSKLKNSGIFLENKIKNSEEFSGDLKAVLLKAHDALQNAVSPHKQEILKQIDKLTLQIDYQQLLSHLSNTTSFYIPYSWDSLKDGNIHIKKAQEGKFFTDIELHLKKYGELRLRLGLFQTNQLNINITTENEELKSMIQENLPSLRKQIQEQGITITTIRFLDDSDSLTRAYNQTGTLDMGFEVKA